MHLGIKYPGGKGEGGFEVNTITLSKVMKV